MRDVKLDEGRGLRLAKSKVYSQHSRLIILSLLDLNSLVCAGKASDGVLPSMSITT